MSHTPPSTKVCDVDLADGRRIRLGPDESDPEHTLIKASFDTELNGGFGPGTVSAPRPKNLDAEDGKLFTAARIYEAETGRTFHEGRVSGVNINDSTVDLSLEGWSKHAEDDEATPGEIFIDRDMGRWGEPTAERTARLIEQGYGPQSGGTRSDEFDPKIVTGVTGVWPAGVNPVTEVAYDAGAGRNIGRLEYAWELGSLLATFHAVTDWRLDALITEHGDMTGDYTETGDLLPHTASPTSGSGSLTAPSTARYAHLRLWWNAETAAGADNTTWEAYWVPIVYGDHGIPAYGSGEDRGLMVDDMFRYTIDKYCPLLNYNVDSIEPTSFPVPHLTAEPGSTARSIFDSLMPFGGSSNYPLTWAVWENRTVHLRSPDNPEKIWRVRRDENASPSREGPDAAEMVNGIKVTYDDGAGAKSVGPPGSGSDYETELLTDLSLGNPANNDGAPHRKVVDAGATSQAGAVLIGRLAMSRANNRAWRGSVNLTGPVKDEAGVEYPVECVRAGHGLVIENDEDTSVRLIGQTQFDGDSTVSASIGAQPDWLDVLLSRQQTVLQGGI